VTQFPQPGYYDPTSPSQPTRVRRTSGLAITALVLSLVSIILCCAPITATLAIILGLIGVVILGPNSPKKGRGMALAAVLIGIVLLTVSILGGMWGYRSFIKPIMVGPREALTQGFAGNFSGFKSQFHGAGATAPDVEARAFLDALRSRYGEFQNCRFDDSGGASARPQPGQPEAPFPYLLDFSNQKDVPATALMIFADQATGQFVMKWGSIHVHDAANGDLKYPGSAPGPSSSAPSRGGRGGGAPGSNPPPSTTTTSPNG